MTNGIAIHKTKIGFDYWEDGTAGSGWVDSTGGCLRNCLNRFVGPTKKREWRKDYLREWGPNYTLAVPEQLVWWDKDDQKI